jgi:hypothetical protein
MRHSRLNGNPELWPLKKKGPSSGRILVGFPHGRQSEDALQRQICLIDHCSHKVVGGELVSGDQRFSSKILGPLGQLGVVLRQVAIVSRSLNVRQGHDDHVSTLWGEEGTQ